MCQSEQHLLLSLRCEFENLLVLPNTKKEEGEPLAFNHSLEAALPGLTGHREQGEMQLACWKGSQCTGNTCAKLVLIQKFDQSTFIMNSRQAGTCNQGCQLHLRLVSWVTPSDHFFAVTTLVCTTSTLDSCSWCVPCCHKRAKDTPGDPTACESLQAPQQEAAQSVTTQTRHSQVQLPPLAAC